MNPLLLIVPFGIIWFIFMDLKNNGIPQQKPFRLRLLADLDSSNLQGIPAAFVLSVAILETGNGAENHLSETNNPFNIHAIGNQPYVLVGQEHIRKFASFKDAISGFVSLISQDPRYSNAYAGAQNSNALEFFQGLQNGGYATNSNYANELMRTFEGLA